MYDLSGVEGAPGNGCLLPVKKGKKKDNHIDIYHSERVDSCSWTSGPSGSSLFSGAQPWAADIGTL